MTHTAPGPLTPARFLPPAAFLARLTELDDQLNATDLRPSPEVNEAFGRLVEMCTVVDDELTDRVLNDPVASSLVPSLRSLSARGESALEHEWARRIIAADDPWAELRKFPYLDNYRRLVRFELAGLTAVGTPPPESAVILGAGPLPLTGLELARRHGIGVTNVDNDAEACELANGVSRALGIGERAATLHGDARAPALLPQVADAGVVLLAALVGADSTAKRGVSRSLSGIMHRDSLLLTRSAHRLRTALYPPVSPDDLSGFRTLLEMHPCDDVVNSVLVSRPEPAAGPDRP
ncbi:nicotianamine synthase [Lipingzhangella halophila]|uniref:Nicotianamine synthase n=1 Tax=Lipingzhangella halophila TaxID=1783352 RepID=A0A7W7RGH7_9ACTN|nr:nicotianamine synthase family protein [Lipingzhangella halophila]MBB4931563.1 nicotianamine synthase [Lipingzhangella halophila]